MSIFKGRCGICLHGFGFRFVDSQLNDSFYAYCAFCGRTALFGLRGVPSKVPRDWGYRIGHDSQKFIQSCECGGRFRQNAEPRCPKCGSEIGTPEFEGYVNKMMGPQWDWRQYGGQFCMVIGERVVRDNWQIESI